MCDAIQEKAGALGYEEDCTGQQVISGYMVQIFRGRYVDAYQCESFIMWPGEIMFSAEARGFLYLFALLYTFLGIAIVADVFMGAIDTITSAEVDVVRVDPASGKEEVIKEKYWNATVANLTLMALGSSAPEILLSVIGTVFSLGEPADVLGPSTIVGSAAFNLLVITAVCVTAPEPGDGKLVKNLGVFYVTSFSSVFAYVWLYLIVDQISPGVIKLWEAVLTFLFFPILVFVAYGMDCKWNFKGSKRAKPGQVSPDEDGGEEGGQKKDGDERIMTVVTATRTAEDMPNALASEYLKYRTAGIRMISGGARIKLGDQGEKMEVIEEVEQEPEFLNGMSSDPYCVVLIGGNRLKTKFKRKVLNPVWDTTFFLHKLELSKNTLMKIEVWDHDDLTRDDLLCSGELDLSDLKADEQKDVWVEMNGPGGEPGQGRVHAILKLGGFAATTGKVDLVINIYEGKDLPASERANKYLDAVSANIGAGLQKFSQWGLRQRAGWRRVQKHYHAQFLNALTVSGPEGDDGEELPPTGFDLFMHFMTVPWKMLFALIPPPEYYGGKLCFGVALIMIGGVTAVVGELAALFGCVCGLKEPVTAITFVALGTSLPDTFASQLAARYQPTADDAVGNVTGSNSVNVFLGIGLPWVIATVYHAAGGSPNPDGTTSEFLATSPGFGLGVIVFCICATMCLSVIFARRYFVGYELGGPPAIANATAAFFVSLWLAYVLTFSFRMYGEEGDPIMSFLPDKKMSPPPPGW